MPAAALREFVDFTRGHRQLRRGTTTFTFAGERFRQIIGADMQCIPFCGSGPTMTALLAGVAGLDLPVRTAIYAPAGTPCEVVDRLNAAIVRVLHTPSVRERFLATAETIVASPSEALAVTAASDTARMKELAARIGLAPR